VIEDTPTTMPELTALFGTDVGDLVAEATDDKSLPKAGRRQSSRFRTSGFSLQRCRLHDERDEPHEAPCC